MAVPKIIPYDVELRSVNPVRSFDRPKAYTNDRKSVEFQFKILDMTSIELNTATAITLVYMRDGSFFANPSTDVERVGNVFSYLLKENEGNHAGVAQIQLVVTIDDAEFASQLFDFEIINGLETKVAQEIMIYDWSTLTRDARAYIDQFVADEVFRDAQFENAQFDRNVAFVSSQESRDLAFGVEQTDRGAAFTTEQTNRNTAFNSAQDSRDLAFTASESGRTTAETGRVTAEDGRVTAEDNRVTKEGQRVTAENNRVTAEGNRVTAESGRVTAESGRATTFAGYNARITGMEADVNANATNLVTNGDFSNGTTGWSNDGASLSVSNNTLSASGSGASANPGTSQIIGTVTTGSKYYLRAKVRVTNALCTSLLFRLTFGSGTTTSVGTISAPVQSQFYTIGTIFTQTDQSGAFTMILRSTYADAATASGKVMEAQYVEVFNLTAIFGAGNEPTAEQMDGIMAKFTNSWFDGTKNLFRASDTLKKQIAIDARTEFDAKNDVVNGDFSKGTDWVLPSGFTIENNELKSTATTPYIVSTQNRLFIDGRKYYFKVSVKNTSAIGCSCDVGVTAGSRMSFDGGSTSYISKSVIFTTSGTTYRNVSLLFITETGDGLPRYCDNVQLIDLTAAFGAGKEPTIAEMDKLMARYPNSWFDGVKPIQTIETLYQEKAEKYQESWIAPTLLNAWINVGGTDDAAGYMKDSLGFVHLKGIIYNGVITAGTVLFTLPAGYRPSKKLPVMALTSGGVIRLDIKNTGEVSIVSATSNSWLTLNNLTFRAEV